MPVHARHPALASTVAAREVPAEEPRAAADGASSVSPRMAESVAEAAPPPVTVADAAEAALTGSET